TSARRAGARGAARRAERGRRVGRGRRRLCARARAHRLRGHGRATARPRGYPRVLSGRRPPRGTGPLYRGQAVPEAAPMVLSVEEVTLEFEGLRALSSVSFAVDEGALTALVGPNGAGKTSLLNCMGAFYTPTRGRIIFHGAPLPRLAPHRAGAAGLPPRVPFAE